MSDSASPPGTILIADDNRVNLLLLGRGLEQQGHTVVFAGHGLEALDLLRRQNFDLVLLDVVLPGADGYSVCRSIKRAQQTRKLPVVMLTSKSSPFDKIRGSLAGCDNYLTKPATALDFERTVMRYLQPAVSAGVRQLARSSSKRRASFSLHDGHLA